MDVDVVDCRFLPNPHWVDELWPLTGQDLAVRDYVLDQPATQTFLTQLESCSAALLPGYRERGQVVPDHRRSPAGHHRLVTLAEVIADRLRGAGSAHRHPPGHRQVTKPRRVVALGGGHGLAAACSGPPACAAMITAVVSVADDGGPAGHSARRSRFPRRATSAAAWSRWPTPTPCGARLEHRFEGGEAEDTHSATW